jgi:WD40 repeat protein
MRRLLLILLLVWTAAAKAEPPPLQQPFLRINAGMHVAAPFSISVSADGTRFVTASTDQTVKLWNAATGELIRTFRPPLNDEHGGETREAAISPDGKFIVTSGPGGDDDPYGKKVFLYIFEAASGTIVNRIGPLDDNVQDIVWSPDGRYLAAGLVQSGVRLWHYPYTAPPLSDTNYAANTPVSDIAFNAAGQLFAAGGDGSIRVYDTELAPITKATLPHDAVPLSLAIAPDGKSLAIGYAKEARIDILSLPAFTKIARVDTRFAGFGDLGEVAWSADGETLYASGTYYDKPLDKFQIYAFDKQGIAPARVLKNLGGNVLAMAQMPKGGPAFVSADPSIGILEGADIFIGPVSADMSNKLGEHFTLSQDGTRVRFTADYAGTDPWLFDATKLTLAPAPDIPAGFTRPDVTSLAITNWEDSAEPALNGAPLPVFPGDFSHAVAIAPGAASFVQATSEWLIRFDAQGGVLWRLSAPAEGWGVNVSADGKLAIGAFGDGTLRWYRLSDGEPLLTLFMHRRDRRWIAWTPSGYYTASPGGEDLIGWAVNGKSWMDAPSFYPASRFRDRFYRPDIVQRVLALRNEAEAVDQANTAAGTQPGEAPAVQSLLPASVTISGNPQRIETTTPQLHFTYRLESPTGRAVTRVEARIDGRPVITRGVSQSDDYPLGEDLEFTIAIPPRTAELTLTAFIGDQPSVPATVQVVWTGPGGQPAKGKLFAVLVGVSSYQDARMHLNYAAKDAADLAAALKSQDGLFYSSVEITALTDAAASKAAVETELLRLKSKAGPEDTVLVFLAGHGMTDAALDFYYLPHGATMDKALLQASAVDGRLIRKALSDIPGRVVLMMDTCRSGAGITGVVDMSRTANDMAQETAGIVMFASSQGREDSLESSEWENGAFTEALLSILDDTAVYGDDGRLSIPELEEAITVRVASLTGERQHAGMTKYGATPRFFIAERKAASGE